jgi:hypothetical protein
MANYADAVDLSPAPPEAQEPADFADGRDKQS